VRKLTTLLLLAAALPSCTYDKLTDFATSAAATADAMESQAWDYQDSQVREDAMLMAQGRPVGTPVDDHFVETIVQIARALKDHFSVIATLASDEAVDFNAEFEGLATAISSASDTRGGGAAVGATEVKAFATVAAVAVNAAGSWWRHSELKELLPDAVGPVGTLCSVGESLATNAVTQYMNEKAQVLSLLPAPVAGEGDVVAPQQTSMFELEVASYLATLEDRIAAAEAMGEGMKAIRVGYAAIAKAPGGLDEEKVIKAIDAFLASSIPENNTIARRSPSEPRGRKPIDRVDGRGRSNRLNNNGRGGRR